MNERVRQQVTLEFDDKSHLTAWIDIKFNPKVGMSFTGKDGRTGKIIATYPMIIDVNEINRTWKVGGL